MNALTAAHPSLPFGTLLEVTQYSHRPRGRGAGQRPRPVQPKNRILDLSYAAAKEIGVVGPGTASVELYLALRHPASCRRRASPSRWAPSARPSARTSCSASCARSIRRRWSTSDGTWNRVQIGVFDDRDQAESLRRELAAIGISSIVVGTR